MVHRAGTHILKKWKIEKKQSANTTVHSLPPRAFSSIIAAKLAKFCGILLRRSFAQIVPPFCTYCWTGGVDVDGTVNATFCWTGCVDVDGTASTTVHSLPLRAFSSIFATKLATFCWTEGVVDGDGSVPFAAEIYRNCNFCSCRTTDKCYPFY